MQYYNVTIDKKDKKNDCFWRKIIIEAKLKFFSYLVSLLKLLKKIGMYFKENST